MGMTVVSESMTGGERSAKREEEPRWRGRLASQTQRRDGGAPEGAMPLEEIP
jgi:hypothetical protein